MKTFVSAALLGALGFVLALYAVVWWIYNHVVAGMFGWPHVGYWKTVALIIFIGLIVKLLRGK